MGVSVYRSCGLLNILLSLLATLACHLHMHLCKYHGYSKRVLWSPNKRFTLYNTACVLPVLAGQLAAIVQATIANGVVYTEHF